jgi:apolipoprotein N-acyltransferase
MGSGLILALAFPKAEIPGLAWIALTPLLFTIDQTAIPAVFGYSWLFAFSFFVTILYPVPLSLVTYAHASFVAALTKLVLLSSLEALSIGAAVTTGEFVARRLGLSRIIVLPLAWVGFELFRTYVPVGFPWGLLGYAAYRDVRLIQFAEFTGIYGVSGLIVLVNVTVYQMLASGWNLNEKLFEAAPALGALGIAALFGAIRVHQLHSDSSVGSLKVALVQANIPQNLKWDPSEVEPTFQAYSQETLKAAQQHPDLIIWPESAVPFLFMDLSYYGVLYFHRDYRNKLVRFIKGAHQTLLFGAPALALVNGVSTRNRADLVSADGELVGYYDKMTLVPFDEYVPLDRYLGRFIEKPVESIGPITAGTRQTLLPVKEAKLGVLICYESMFPSRARDYVEAGANILVNLSNDAWFGTTSAPYQLLAMASMRALENHTLMIRVANTGISAVIEPTGEIAAATKLGTRVTEIETVSWINSPTFYTRHGDLFAEFCLVATTIAALLALAIRRSNVKPHETKLAA